MLPKRLMVLAVVLLAAAPVLRAQTYTPDRALVMADSANPLGVFFGVCGGVVLSNPRGSFPSVIVGEDTVERSGSGTVGPELARTGTGGRFSLAAVVPMSDRFALALRTGTLYWVARYAGDATRLPTRFEVQTWQAALGLEVSIYSDGASFASAGLRTIYVNGLIEGTVITLANRLETTAFAPDGSASQAVGSFDNTTPLATPLDARLGAGIRFAPATHLELLAEASYALALNDVFSDDAVGDNDFTVDHISLLLGVGYRW